MDDRDLRVAQASRGRRRARRLDVRSMPPRSRVQAAGMEVLRQEEIVSAVEPAVPRPVGSRAAI